MTNSIATLARTCAATLLAQGWDPTGSIYGLGAFSGDREALATALGREPTREECRDFERQIRATLAASEEQLTPAETAEIERKALAAAG